MTRRIAPWGGAVIALLVLAGCSTLNVKTPDGMFLSTDDYVSGVFDFYAEGIAIKKQ